MVHSRIKIPNVCSATVIGCTLSTKPLDSAYSTINFLRMSFVKSKRTLPHVYYCLCLKRCSWCTKIWTNNSMMFHNPCLYSEVGNMCRHCRYQYGFRRPMVRAYLTLSFYSSFTILIVQLYKFHLSSEARQYCEDKFSVLLFNFAVASRMLNSLNSFLVKLEARKLLQSRFVQM